MEIAGAAGAPRRALAYGRVDANKRRGWQLLLLLGLLCLPAAAFVALYLLFAFVVLIGVALGFLATTEISGDNWTVWAVLIPVLAAVLVLLVPIVLYRVATSVVLRLSGARPVPAGEYPDVRRTVENLCIGSGLPVPALRIVDSPAANAFSTGLNPARSTLVFTTGLPQLLDRLELEAVMAHEVSRIGNYDTRLDTILAAGVAFLRLPFAVVIAVFRFLFRVHWAVGAFFLLYLGLPALVGVPLAFAASFDMVGEDPEQAALMLATLAVPLYSLLVAPFIAEVIRAAVSRQRRFLADADAVLLARTSEPLALALTRMQPAAALPVPRATAHLWTVDPLPDDPWWERFWPAYHPPVSERVQLIASMGSGVPDSTLREARRRGEHHAATYQPVSAAPALNNEPAPGFEAPADADENTPPDAYRLAGPQTLVYHSPDRTSPVVARLPAGSLVTVHSQNGAFLHVITPDDEFGYIPADTRMKPVEVPGPARASSE